MPRAAALAPAMSVAWPSLGLLREWMAQDHPGLRELAKVRDVGYIDLPTGHWPQFTKPGELSQAILASVAPPKK